MELSREDLKKKYPGLGSTLYRSLRRGVDKDAVITSLKERVGGLSLIELKLLNDGELSKTRAEKYFLKEMNQIKKEFDEIMIFLNEFYAQKEEDSHEN